MNVALPEDRMPEAEVALRLAFHLLTLPGSDQTVKVAIDGAQVLVAEGVIFPIGAFLLHEGWALSKQSGKNAWQGEYAKGDLRLDVRAQSGVGDVVCDVGGRTVRAECKKGPLVPRKGDRERALLHEALGQLLTVREVAESDLLVVAVPRTEPYRKLARSWRTAPLVARSGIRIALVGRDGVVEGLTIEASRTSGSGVAKTVVPAST